VEEYGPTRIGDVMLDFRMYDSDDLSGCLDLIQAGHDSSFSTERFRWLHEQGPGGPSRIALCLAAGQIVGIYSVVPKKMRWHNRQLVGGRDVDPVVHPAFRGQGIFTRLLDFGLEHFEGLDLYFNFANSASAAGFAKCGWRILPPLEDRVRQLGYESISSRAFLMWIWSCFLRPASNQTLTRRVTANELTAILAEDTRFLAPMATGQRAAVVRDAKYLRWRYLNHPLHQYDYYFSEPTAESLGIVVCRSDERSGRVEVIDVAGFGMQPSLTDWLDSWGKTNPNALVVTWHTLPAEFRAGFFGNPLQRGKGRQFLVRQIPGQQLPFDAWETENWYLTRGDLEIS